MGAESESRLVGERVAALLEACDPRSVEPERFWGAQFDHGLAWVDFPPGLGGSGWHPSLQQPVDDRLQAAGAPNNWDRNPIGLGVAAPALVSAGNDWQARRHLRPLFTCDEVWCQLYSEPGAGSDLAGVATRATRDGDGWLVEGHKTWISLAHVARWGLLLARSDPSLPKHRGITCFVVDMTGPGVDVRPMRQMTGDAEFGEVLLGGVRLSDGQRLGEVGQGWDVAMATLAHERLAIGHRATIRLAGAMEEALALWARRADKDPALRDELVRLWVESEVVRLTSRRAGDVAGGSAIVKLASSELNQRLRALCLTLRGAEGMLYDSYQMTGPPELGISSADPGRAFLRSRANTVEAGTSEILRTVLGERVLGLPPEPRVDRDRPWSEVPET